MQEWNKYIRVGTNKKNLKEYPDKERELWQAFDTTPYELRLAKVMLRKMKSLSLKMMLEIGTLQIWEH
ncbi:MAG: hypothetical protein NC433_14640 [Clostridiales bacterium]|nr:hypothetical protein [Clostridiales bacterium]